MLGDVVGGCCERERERVWCLVTEQMTESNTTLRETIEFRATFKVTIRVTLMVKSWPRRRVKGDEREWM